MLVAVVDAEAAQGLDERALRLPERYAILGTPRARERRLDAREVELDDLRVLGFAPGVVPEGVLLAVGLDERGL